MAASLVGLSRVTGACGAASLRRCGGSGAGGQEPGRAWTSAGQIRRHFDVSARLSNLAPRYSGRQQLPQHIRQDAAVPVVLDFDRSVDSELERDLLFAVLAENDQGYRHLGTQLLLELDIEHLVA